MDFVLSCLRQLPAHEGHLCNARRLAALKVALEYLLELALVFHRIHDEAAQPSSAQVTLDLKKIKKIKVTYWRGCKVAQVDSKSKIDQIDESLNELTRSQRSLS